ncbi:putative methyltransferase-like protein 21E pseudogene [Amblyraja radiata]|uniref:putative methyltransferase-like protein 21E pseudogene n=1 Tax=Amblyraja radiata TaxID=386614 RepID=UPI0014040BB0|nr:putative methyltransferase-like protein 21E pseudogene [Amblyraja radiata]
MNNTDKEAKLEDEDISSEIMRRRFVPNVFKSTSWEIFHFAGCEIKITETIDCYGAYVWPSAMVLCYYLEHSPKEIIDKNVIEIGSGTGLVSIVASVLGSKVTATDLPHLLNNLQYNISQNTKMRSKYLPQVRELQWGIDLDKTFPRGTCHYNYILAADVVYSHPYLNELLMTFDHLCQDDTVILWAMKFRLEKENAFVERFQHIFDTEVIYDLPSLQIKLYKATRKNIGIGKET